MISYREIYCVEYITQHQSNEKTLLISVKVQILKDIDAEEFALLAQSAGADIVDHYHVPRIKPDPKYFIGSGKAQEIAERIKQEDIGLVIVDQTLTPSQERNLERILQCHVIDRTGLILDIFAQRARTHEGKIQVELAQLQYLASRLVRGFSNLEQQKGGIGLRGPGETQLETDRRLIKVRISQLKDKLEKVRQTRAQGRASRQKASIPTVSLVGYTNAGKSTLFNVLAESDVYAADQLFATLDPTLRHVEWEGLGKVILADTVGFIKDLRHALVDSFRATLEETLEATLLLHIIDSSSPDLLEQIEAVEHVLNEIGADVPILRVYNKIDRSGEEAKIIYAAPNQPERVYVSAHSEQGLELLKQAVQECLLGQIKPFILVLRPKHSKLHSQLHRLQVIETEAYDDYGDLHLTVKISAEKLKQLILQNHFNLDEILGKQADIFKRALEEFERP